mmetsp:Transcript_53288/g.161823  ORF Transcript_53288/g.161823 Transcript_53288/m.161823 type:complete len:271 (+) Transcript_53288:700-1512(+)
MKHTLMIDTQKKTSNAKSTTMKTSKKVTVCLPRTRVCTAFFRAYLSATAQTDSKKILYGFHATRRPGNSYECNKKKEVSTTKNDKRKLDAANITSSSLDVRLSGRTSRYDKSRFRLITASSGDAVKFSTGAGAGDWLECVRVRSLCLQSFRQRPRHQTTNMHAIDAGRQPIKITSMSMAKPFGGQCEMSPEAVPSWQCSIRRLNLSKALNTYQVVLSRYIKVKSGITIPPLSLSLTVLVLRLLQPQSFQHHLRTLSDCTAMKMHTMMLPK